MGLDDLMEVLGEVVDMADDLTDLPRVFQKIRTSSQKKPLSQKAGTRKSPPLKKAIYPSKGRTGNFSARRETLGDGGMKKDLSIRELSRRGLPREELSRRDLAREDLLRRSLSQEDLSREDFPPEDLLQRELSQEDLSLEDLPQRGLPREGLSREDLRRMGLPPETLSPEGRAPWKSVGAGIPTDLQQQPVCGFPPRNPRELGQAIIWAELLGEPLAKKRRKQRMERYYGNQGNARRG